MSLFDFQTTHPDRTNTQDALVPQSHFALHGLIPAHWTEPSSIADLDELCEKVRTKGGHIIEYQSIFSALILSSTFPVFEWVPPQGSRTATGVKHALVNGILGWWSLPGLLWTPAVMINNMLGGIDLTRVLLDPPAPGQPFDAVAMHELNRARKRQQYSYLSFLFFILSVVFAFCVVPYLGK